MRERLARAIVRWIGSFWDRSFEAHSNCQFGYAGLYAKRGRLAEKFGLPLALRLDRKATGDQMVAECWWG